MASVTSSSNCSCRAFTHGASCRSVTLTYRNAAGGTVGADTLAIPPGLRGTVWANGAILPQEFTTEVSSTAPVPAERVMYWPTGSSMLSGGAMSALEPELSSSETASPPPWKTALGGRRPRTRSWRACPDRPRW